jgi:dTMP kinase
MGQGLFITVEGTDGSGKTTQIRLIEKYLREKGYEVIVQESPGEQK